MKMSGRLPSGKWPVERLLRGSPLQRKNWWCQSRFRLRLIRLASSFDYSAETLLSDGPRMCETASRFARKFPHSVAQGGETAVAMISMAL